jgi:hypothetical protein
LILVSKRENMSLANLVVNSKVIHIGGEKVEIKGLTLGTLGVIIKEDIKFLEGFFANVTSTSDMLSESPDLAIKVICHCATETISEEEAKKLPLGVQIALLKEIWDMSLLGEQIVKDMLMSLSKSQKESKLESLNSPKV